MLFPTVSASAAVLLEFDAAAAGAGVTPSAQGWTGSGGMTNNGSYLLQDNTGVPGAQSGEYLSPSLPAATMVRGGAPYGIEFRTRPLTDTRFIGGDWPEMYLTWSDDQFNYNITVDKFAAASSSGNGDIVYGRGSFSPAISNIDWTTPHTVFIGHRGGGGSSVFDFFLDGAIISTITDGSIARTGSYARDAIGFGDGTTGGEDVAGEWYFLRVHNVNDPALVPEPTSLALIGAGVLLLNRRSRKVPSK